MPQHKMEYGELATGYEFAPAHFSLDSDTLAAYLDAAEGDKRIYEEQRIVPPLAVAARAMAALSTGLALPPGAIHVSQELQFLNTASINETLVSRARVNRKVARGKFHMLAIGVNVIDPKGATVLSGETSFILPLS